MVLEHIVRFCGGHQMFGYLICANRHEQKDIGLQPSFNFMLGNNIKNLLTGLGLLAMAELAIVLWFMYGQGFDRVAAQVIIEGYMLLMIPLIAVTLVWVKPYRAFMARFFVEKEGLLRSYLPMLATFTAANIVGIGLPAIVVFGFIRPVGPFQELWLMMGGVAILFGGLQFSIFLPISNRHWYGLGFLVGAALIQWGLKAFVFSFF